MIHPARMMPFDDLLAGLGQAAYDGYVTVQERDSLRLYTYTRKCVKDKAWTPVTLLARGLILDVVERTVVAMPFPKFFNYGERPVSFAGRTFTTYEKVDGSLIILYYHAGAWHTATKGSFDSDQARWARMWLASRLTPFQLSCLTPGFTYLAEAVYPENRIVVSYDYSDLVLLGGYGYDGGELPYSQVVELAKWLECRHVEQHNFSSAGEVVEYAKSLPASREGFVLRLDDGTRVKVKGDEYCRIHRCLSRVTPLAIWESLAGYSDLDMFRESLPEEFHGDFDSVLSLLRAKRHTLWARLVHAAEPMRSWSDKEVGLALSNIDESVRRFIFPYRKAIGGYDIRLHDMLYKAIRPDANVLDGYAPSGVLDRFNQEDI